MEKPDKVVLRQIRGFVHPVGMDFLSGLAHALSDPEATRRLVDSVVQEDKEDGRTYLKIPVESSKTVENIL